VGVVGRVILDLDKDLVRDRLYLFKSLSLFKLGQFKYRLLGLIKDCRRIFIFFESFARDLVACADQASHYRLSTNDIYVIGDVRKMRQAVRKIGDRSDAAD